jgi:hypothetical protein
MQPEGQQQTIGLGQVQRALQSAVGGVLVAQRILGDRPQHVRLRPPVLPDNRSRALQDRGNRGDRGARVVLASRSAASAMRISPCSRPVSVSPARNCPAGPVWPRRTMASSSNARIQGTCSGPFAAAAAWAW